VEHLLTVEDLAAVCGVPVGTCYQWNYRGTGPRKTKVGKYVRYRRVDVEAWLEKQASSDRRRS
jgi:excisionase family DNA binding protein